ncbi:MAG: hypothetical protein IKU47_01935, partial [Oscillospiraceae bacterium]|nr:hypothetical protein [Oscillospiraceae bacterium]
QKATPVCSWCRLGAPSGAAGIVYPYRVIIHTPSFRAGFLIFIDKNLNSAVMYPFTYQNKYTTNSPSQS